MKQNINTNFKAYKTCESSSLQAGNTCLKYDGLNSSNSGTNSKFKSLFRSIDQKISLYDVITRENTFSYEARNIAGNLIEELKEATNSLHKTKVMDRIDEFFENLNKGVFEAR